eukprot:GHVU01160874.1.p1 GENE.GHVU01160874.1~~GHVU01160874.1.p1  ORF type:complete len:220 (-),score=1.87 GHVU01160874.1:68-682(-)
MNDKQTMHVSRLDSRVSGGKRCKTCLLPRRVGHKRQPLSLQLYSPLLHLFASSLCGCYWSDPIRTADALLTARDLADQLSTAMDTAYVCVRVHVRARVCVCVRARACADIYVRVFRCKGSIYAPHCITHTPTDHLCCCKGGGCCRIRQFALVAAWSSSVSQSVSLPFSRSIGPPAEVPTAFASHSDPQCLGRGTMHFTHTETRR